MAAEPQRNPLPFEPGKKRQKAKSGKTPSEPAKSVTEQPQKLNKSEQALATAKESEQTPPFTREEMAVPKIVSDRMVRRMALFCGTPTVLGMATFVVNYIALSQGWFKLPNVVVLLVSISLFALGVLGLSYGVLSASWDEELVGSKLGWREFVTNFGRMKSAWRSTRQKNV